ncbi:MAG: hypothetical protein QW101_06190 [Ignisphaera sp.]|uniref:Uncharacterized protein n=2 Tax=Ignisphaera aggregans TaxID=334771 RepID=A0A832AVK1_9CREN
MVDVKRIVCSFCKAEYTVPTTIVYATCPYCGTTFRLDKPDATVEHYMFSALLDKNSAYRYLKEFALMQIGIAEDFEVNASFESSYQYLIPLYLYEINVKTLCSKGKESIDKDKVEIDIHGGEETAYIVTPATKNIPIAIPSNYSFPARGRRYFKPTVLKEGTYVQPTLDPNQMFEYVKQPYLHKAIEEARISCGESYEVNDNSRYVGIAHYPFWLINYRYRDRRYKSIVDAADGTVLYLEYPMSYGKRLQGLIGGLGVSGIAIAIASVISLIALSAPIPGLIGGLMTSLPGLGVALQKFLRSVGIYRYKVREELVFAPVR